MAREIRLSGIGDHFEQQVINTVRKTTLKAEADIKQFTPVDTGNLRESFDNKIEPFVGEVFTNVEDTELDKIQLKVIQSLSQSNWNNIFRINLGVHDGCN